MIFQLFRTGRFLRQAKTDDLKLGKDAVGIAYPQTFEHVSFVSEQFLQRAEKSVAQSGGANKESYVSSRFAKARKHIWHCRHGKDFGRLFPRNIHLRATSF